MEEMRTPELVDYLDKHLEFGLHSSLVSHSICHGMGPVL